MSMRAEAVLLSVEDEISSEAFRVEQIIGEITKLRSAPPRWSYGSFLPV